MNLIDFFIFLSFIVRIKPVSVRDNFKYCEGNSAAKHLNLDSNCKREKIKSSASLDEFKQALGINQVFQKNLSVEVVFLSQITHQVSGTGIQCRMEKVIVSTFVNIFWSKSKEITTESIVLTARDCWAMINSGKCKDNNMKCDGKTCKYTASFDLQYVYLSSSKHEDFNCETHERILTAKHENQTLFGEIDGPNSCKANDLYCYKMDYLVVWKKDIIHKCKYELISGLSSHEFKFVENTNLGLLSEQDSLYLSLTTVEKTCNSEIIGTHEGLYVTQFKNANKFRKTAKTLKDINDLALADRDFLHYQSILDKFSVHDSLCLLLMNTIKVFSIHQNGYLKLINMKGKEIILFTMNEYVYVPHCIDINEITVHEKTDNCFDDVAISFIYNNRSINAFLQNDNIIKRDSKLISCDSIHNRNIFIGNDKKIVRDLQANIYLSFIDDQIQKIDFFELSKVDANYHHNQDLIESIDVLDEIKKYSQVSDSVIGDFVVSVGKQIDQNTVSALKKPIERIGDVTQEVIDFGVRQYDNLKIVILVIVVLFSFVFLILIIIGFIFFINRRKSKINASVKYCSKFKKLLLI